MRLLTAKNINTPLPHAQEQVEEPVVVEAPVGPHEARRQVHDGRHPHALQQRVGVPVHVPVPIIEGDDAQIALRRLAPRHDRHRITDGGELVACRGGFLQMPPERLL